MLTNAPVEVRGAHAHLKVVYCFVRGRLSRAGITLKFPVNAPYRGDFLVPAYAATRPLNTGNINISIISSLLSGRAIIGPQIYAFIA
jgi:hypothetical protein